MNVLAALVIIIPLILFLTPISMILRSEIVYWSLLLTSLLFPWIAFEIVRNGLGNYDLMWFLATVNSTIVLGLYKLFDRFILKTKGRHLFISWKGHYLHTDDSWLDLIFQIILMMIPVLWIGIWKWIFE